MLVETKVETLVVSAHQVSTLVSTGFHAMRF